MYEKQSNVPYPHALQAEAHRGDVGGDTVRCEVTDGEESLGRLPILS